MFFQKVPVPVTVASDLYVDEGIIIILNCLSSDSIAVRSETPVGIDRIGMIMCSLAHDGLLWGDISDYRNPP